MRFNQGRHIPTSRCAPPPRRDWLTVWPHRPHAHGRFGAQHQIHDHIQTARGHVGGDQHPELSGAEGGHRLLTDGLRDVAVKALGLVPGGEGVRGIHEEKEDGKPEKICVYLQMWGGVEGGR